MSALGSLVVKLALEYAEYTKGLDKSDQDALKFAQNAQKHFDKASAATSDFLSGLVAKAAVAVTAVVGVGAVIDKLNSSIDTLGKLDDMAQKTGSSVENLSRLQKVASAFGGDFEKVDGILVKLSKGMATADDETNKVNKALKALGVESKDAAGKLRDPSEVLVEASKKLQGFEDGANKSALAIDLLGKQGAEALPYLNDLAENVDKFTGVSAAAAKQAADFQDNLGRLKVKSEELYTSIASAALPAMTDLAGAFLDTANQRDGLIDGKTAQWADDLALGLARVADVAILLPRLLGAIAGSVRVVVADVSLLNTIAENTNPLKAAITVAKGGSPLENIRNAVAERNKILEEGNQKLDDLWNKPANQIEQALLARIDGRFGAAIDEAMDMAAAVDKKNAAKRALNYTTGNPKKPEVSEANDYDKLNKTLQDKIALTEKEIALGRSLSESEKEIAKLYRGRAEGTVKLTDDEAQLLEQGIKKLSLNEQLLLNRAATEKMEKEQLDTAQKQITSAYETLQKLQEEVDTYGMLPSAITAVNVAKLEMHKTQLEVNEGTAEEIARTEGLIAVAKRLAALQGSKETLDANKKNAEEASAAWKNSFNDMSGYIGDGLQRGFEDSGKLIKSFILAIKSAFARLVLSPIIAPVSAAYASFMNPTAPQATGTNPAGSTAGSIAGGLFGAGGLGGSIAAGAGWLTGASTLGGSLAAGASLVGTGTLAGGMAGAGMIVGALGPIALGIAAAVAIWKKLDTSGTYHAGGASSASAAGVTSVRAESLNFQATQVSAETEKMTAALASGIVNILDSTATAFGKTAGYTAATAFADDTSKDGAWGALLIGQLGEKIVDWQDTRTSRWAPKEFADGAEGQAQYLAALSASVRTALDDIGLPVWAKTMLDGVGAGASIEDIAKVVDSINATERALVAMGDKLTGFAGLSDGAVSALIAASGGIDSLATSASSYYDNFYNEAEKMAGTTKQVGDALAAVGLAMPANRDAFRAQLEAQIALGEEGVPTVAAMLKVQGAFAQLNPVVDQTADTLASTNKGYQDQIDSILKASMSAFDVRAMEIKGMDASTVALYDRLAGLKAEATASELATAAIQKASDAAAAQAKANADAYQSFGNVLIDTMNRAKDAAKSLSAFNDSLALGNLSSLSKGSQYDLAKQQYLGADILDKQSAATAFLQASQAKGGSKLDYARDFAMVVAGNSATANANRDIPAAAVAMFRMMQSGVSAHANGGIADGWSIVGENGPELANFTQPARIYTAPQTRTALGSGNGDSGTKEEIKQMRIELKAALEAIALNTGGTTRLLKRVVVDDVLQTAAVPA